MCTCCVPIAAASNKRKAYFSLLQSRGCRTTRTKCAETAFRLVWRQTYPWYHVFRVASMWKRRYRAQRDHPVAAKEVKAGGDRYASPMERVAEQTSHPATTRIVKEGFQSTRWTLATLGERNMTRRPKPSPVTVGVTIRTITCRQIQNHPENCFLVNWMHNAAGKWDFCDGSCSGCDIERPRPCIPACMPSLRKYGHI
jgi:hypothetical protein